MTHITHPNRRAVTRGLAWTAPALLVVGAAPAFAASTGACTYHYSTDNANPNVWNPNTDAPPAGTSKILVPRTSGSQTTSVSFTAAAFGGAKLDTNYNLAYGYQGTNTVSSTGQIGNGTDPGLMLNLSGTGYETVTVTFGQVVSNVMLYFRDLSWYHSVGATTNQYPKALPATPQEFLSFSVPTTVTNGTNPGEENPELNTSGSVAANTKIYRVRTGSPPGETNHNYYDLEVTFPGPLSSFSFNYGYGPNTTDTSAIITQLKTIKFCAGS